MWKELPSSKLCIKYVKNEMLEIYVTNFISIWFLHLSQQQFLDHVKKCNSFLEAIEEEELGTAAESILISVDTLTQVDVCESLVSCDLQLGKVSDSGYPVKLLLSLTVGPKEMFFQKVTYPLWQSTQDLLASQRELRNLLVEKNKEIKEYKQEGGKILKCFKTDSFNEEAHLNRHKKYVESFSFTTSETIDDVYLKTKKECFSIVKHEIISKSIISTKSEANLNNQSIAAATTSVITKSAPENETLIVIKKEPEVSSQVEVKPDSSIDSSQRSQQNEPSLGIRQEIIIKSENRSTEPRTKRKKTLNL